MGFSSGVPFALMLFTLNFWLYEQGISFSSMGWLAWTSLPYTLKFFLSFFVDFCPIPYVTKSMGMHRGWALVVQIQMMVLFGGLGFLHPSTSWVIFMCMCCWIYFCAAFQDIALESYRAEITTASNQSISAAASSMGFRTGLWGGTYVPLQIAHYFSWHVAFWCMGGLMVVGVCSTLFSRSPSSQKNEKPREWAAFLVTLMKKNVTSSSFLWIVFLLFSYKWSDVFCRSMMGPFFLKMGYSKELTAHVDKFLGLFASLAGSFLGGWVINVMNIPKAFMIWSVVQAVAWALWIPHEWMGYSVEIFTANIVVMNFSGGMGNTVLLAYLSSLCHKPGTAVKYAFISSVGSLGRIGASFTAGFVAGMWPLFFTCGSILCLLTCVLAWKKTPLKQKIQ